MRFYTPILASVLAAGMASAQQVNLFEFGYCGVTSYTSRHGVGSGSDGWACYHVPAVHNRGAYQTADAAGTGATVTSVKTLYGVMQDQDSATVEPFKFAIFLDDPALPGNPGWAATDPATGWPVPALETGWMQNAANTGVRAWGWTWTFGTPVEAVVPADQSYHLGFFIPLNTGWGQTPADGLSIHGGWFANAGTQGGDNPSVNAINAGAIANCTQSIDLTGGNLLGTASQDRSIRLAGGTFGPTLRIGADIDANSRRPATAANPNYGYGGLYPDFTPSRLDGLAFRVENKNMPNAAGFILVSVNVPGTGSGGFSQFPINPLIPGVGQVGDYHLDPVGMGLLGVQIPAALDAAGLFDQIVIATGNLLPPQALGVWSFQHVALDVAAPGIVFSNAAALNSL